MISTLRNHIGSYGYTTGPYLSLTVVSQLSGGLNLSVVRGLQMCRSMASQVCRATLTGSHVFVAFADRRLCEWLKFLLKSKEQVRQYLLLS